jgi:hypothetical protein
MTMSEENKTRTDAQLVMGDYLGLSIGGIVVMLIVWLTLNIPDARQRQANKFCYHHCVIETDDKMLGKFTSGPKYITLLRKCYEDCMQEENKEKDEKNTD